MGEFDLTGALTVGGWFRFDAPSIGAQTSLLGRWRETGADDRCYLLDKTAANLPRFQVSRLGTAATVVSVSGATAVTAGPWWFLAGRYTPSGNLELLSNNGGSTLTLYTQAGAPASIFNGSVAFRGGASDTPVSNFLDGQMTLFFLCGEAVSTAQLRAYFEATRSLLGI